MDYQRILYSSDAIGRIPDHWIEEVPFLMKYNKREQIAFLYFKKSGTTMAEVVRLILIDRLSGAVTEISDKELLIKYPDIYPVFYYSIPEDYQTQLIKKDVYKQLFKESLKKTDGEGEKQDASFMTVNSETVKTCELLFRDIVSEEAYDSFFSILSLRSRYL